eukprot:8448858-Lingulodinium_polyedra.AAC.1
MARNHHGIGRSIAATTASNTTFAAPFNLRCLPRAARPMPPFCRKLSRAIPPAAYCLRRVPHAIAP